MIRKVHTLNAGKDDHLHEKQLEKTGFWGSAGAGVLPICSSSKRILLGLRSSEVEEPLTWGGWGGAIDSKENPKEAALRELREETGFRGSIELTPLYTFKKKEFVYTNFLGLVAQEFLPRLSAETSEARWCEFSALPGPMHFGLISILQDRVALNRILRHVNG